MGRKLDHTRSARSRHASCRSVATSAGQADSALITAVQAQTRAAPRTRHQSAPFTSRPTRAILAGLPRHALHVLGGLLAQSVEQRTFNPLVTGSSPVQPTKCRVSIEVLGLLAQLVEQRTLNPLVEGSNPSGPTNILEGLIVQTIRPSYFCASLRVIARLHRRACEVHDRGRQDLPVRPLQLFVAKAAVRLSSRICGDVCQASPSSPTVTINPSLDVASFR